MVWEVFFKDSRKFSTPPEWSVLSPVAGGVLVAVKKSYHELFDEAFPMDIARENFSCDFVFRNSDRHLQEDIPGMLLGVVRGRLPQGLGPAPSHGP